MGGYAPGASNLSSGTVASSRLPEATSSALGAVKKNQVLYKYDGAGYNSPNLPSSLRTQNIPAGKYKITIGARSFTASSSTAYIRVQDVSTGDYLEKWGSSFICGIASGGGATVYGQAVTGIFEFTSTMDLKLVYNNGAGSSIGYPFIIIEKLNSDYEEITTEWN